MLRGTMLRETRGRRQSRVVGGRSRLCCAASTGKDLYGVLGVSADADLKQIKQAYRQKAKKLHPDVNKAKDAQERFLECKMAYQVLSDSKSRTEYDRKRRGSGYAGAGSSSSGGWGGFGMGDDFWRAAASGNGYQRRRQPEEEFYGFEDFFRDLDKELDGATKDGASLFSSLANELVEFLEEGLKDLESELADVSDDFDAMAQDISRKYSKYTYDPKTGSGSWGATGQSSKGTSGAKPPPQSGSTDDDIDQTLAEMKKRMGL